MRCLKTHYRKSLAKLRLLAFEEKDFTVNVLEAMKLLRHARNSVFEVTIQNCFKKVNFIRLKAEDEDVEVESNVNRDAEGIWERLQECGWVPETFDFSEYSKSDENIVTRETVTESDILRGIQTVAETVQEESDNDDDGSNTVEALLNPVEALTSLRQLDRYLRCHDDEEMLRLLKKIQNYVVHKIRFKTKAAKDQRLFC